MIEHTLKKAPKYKDSSVHASNVIYREKMEKFLWDMEVELRKKCGQCIKSYGSLDFTPCTVDEYCREINIRALLGDITEVKP